MVGWIKMALGTEVGLGPGDIALDGNPAPPTETGTASPTFRPMSIMAKQSPISATAELLLLLKSCFSWPTVEFSQFFSEMKWLKHSRLILYYIKPAALSKHPISYSMLASSIIMIIIIIIMTKLMTLLPWRAIAKVHQVHLMNADWVPDGHQPSDRVNQLGCESG